MNSHPRLDRLPRAQCAPGYEIVIAATPLARLRGLAGLATISSDMALLLPRCSSVHTLGMRFALDLVWLDASGNPLRLDKGVGPRRLKCCRGARAVLETRAGTGEALQGTLLGELTARTLLAR
ncbi:MAG: DUF192 domain-containing protein [Actinomycetota bacterium]|nr:DUF192 domain-containing protein [Actinomycetota bacterium]